MSNKVKDYEQLQEERKGHTKHGRVDSTTHSGPPQDDNGPNAGNEATAGPRPESHPIAEKAYFSGAVDSKKGKLSAAPSENQDPNAERSFEQQHRPTNRPTNAPKPKPSTAPRPKLPGY